MKSIRILVVDDHPVVRAGIRGMLESADDFRVVGEAEDGARAVEAATELTPDIVLIDLQMPNMDGAEATRRIRTAHPDTHVLILTTYDTDADILRAIEAGATGYLLKDSSREELFHGIRSAARGESVLAPSVASKIMGKVSAGGDARLSPREIDVLRMVADGLANKQIARRLFLSEATVKTHLLHLFRKLGVDSRTEAVTVALKRGVIRLDED